MPIIRRTLSPLGNAIVKDVTQFIYDNANAMSRDINLSTRDGAEAMAHAICYAISKALGAGLIKVSFDAGVVAYPPSPQFPGTSMYTAMKPNVIEP